MYLCSQKSYVSNLGIYIPSLGTYISNLGTQVSKLGTKLFKGESIRFKPDPLLLKQMNKEATFERTETDIVVPSKPDDSREERIRKALAIIDKQGYMTLSDYAIATSQSRSAASRDLIQLANDPTSGITTRGSHSHKVWVGNK